MLNWSYNPKEYITNFLKIRLGNEKSRELNFYIDDIRITSGRIEFLFYLQFLPIKLAYKDKFREWKSKRLKITTKIEEVPERFTIITTICNFFSFSTEKILNMKVYLTFMRFGRKRITKKVIKEAEEKSTEYNKF